MQTDCIVVGGGIIGSLTACELATAGLRVTLIERHQLGREASWAGAGVLAPLPPWDIPIALEPLLHWSQQRYASLAQELAGRTGIDCQWIQSGLMVFSQDSGVRLEAWCNRNRTSVESLDERHARELEPELGEFSSALRVPGVSQIRNPRLLKAIRSVIEASGVSIHECVEVHGLNIRNGIITGVHTSQGLYNSNTVVIASGAWSGSILTELPCPLKIEPARGQMLLYKASRALFRNVLLQDGLYLVPRADGHMLVGSTVEFTGFDKSTTSAAKEQLHVGAMALVPRLEDCSLIGHWAGLRPYAHRAVPVIGPHPEIHGLYANSGHFRLGVTLAPGSARLLADLIVGRAPVTDPNDYAWPQTRSNDEFDSKQVQLYVH